jgi:hypothetical protein
VQTLRIGQVGTGSRAREPDTVDARHLYALPIDPPSARINRDQLMPFLHERGIGSRVR